MANKQTEAEEEQGLHAHQKQAHGTHQSNHKDTTPQHHSESHGHGGTAAIMPIFSLISRSGFGYRLP